MINLEKELREQPDVLARVIGTNKAVIDSIVSDIKSYKNVTNVVFAARGTSDHASIYAQYLIERYIGLPCGLATPSVITKYNGKLNYKNSLVIGVSQSGMAEDVLAVINRANENGALTVSVTNNQKSPLASAAKYHLFCDAGEERSIAATKTFTSEMYLLANLCAEWSGDAELKKELSLVPGAVKELLSYMPEKVLSFAQRYRFMKRAVVVGRGMNYSVALEAAIKIMETNSIGMSGYAASDFQHGPLAQLSSDNAAIVLAAKGPTFDDALAVIEKLRPTQAEIVIITDSKELAEKYPQSLLLPELPGDSVSPYLFGVTVQLIACMLTQVKGIDPDKSAVLNKITVTK